MAKRQDKSNKTAHVLNLITSPAQKQAAAQKAAEAAADSLTEADLTESPAAGDEAAEAAEINQQAAQVRQPLIPPILQVANHHDENLAEQINNALAQELAADEAAAGQAQGPQPVNAPSAPPLAEQPPQSNPSPQPQADVPPAPQVNTSQPQAATPPPAPLPQIPPRPEPAPFKLPASAIVSSFSIPEAPPVPPLQEELQYVNIMQKLVESMAQDYIEKLGVCRCLRCQEDVKALALTNLGPKYTVFPASERIPMLTLYERRYASVVAAELTKACAIVKANPRHN